MQARPLSFRPVLVRSVLLLVNCVVISPVVCVAQPIYSIEPIGLVGPEHTRDDGYKYSIAEDYNDLGQAAGYSERYDGDSILLGRSVWVYDGVDTVDVGLTGIEHTRDDGYKWSAVQRFRRADRVAGSSHRFVGGALSLGESAWLYNGVQSRDIGLTGSEHTRVDGYKSSSVHHVNGSGLVVGTSERFQGGATSLGQTAWLYDGVTTTDVGLTGAEYTRSDGYKFNEFRTLNESGQSAGAAKRFNGGTTDLGESAWVNNGVGTVVVGLTGIEHTNDDGYKYSRAYHFNQVGQAGGLSHRYDGGEVFLGQSAWVYDGVQTVQVGLTGAEHTQLGGYKYSNLTRFNPSGQAAGFARRYEGTSDNLGQSAWLYDGEKTIDIGLVGPEHTRDDGFKNSWVSFLNHSGQAAGYAYRYNGGATLLGQSAWFYDGVSTIDIGPKGPEYTGADGRGGSGVAYLNQAGQVVGTAGRYNGGMSSLGTSVWVYDGVDTIDIGLRGIEHSRNDGYLRDSLSAVNQSLHVGGVTERFNGGATHLGQSAWVYDGVSTVHVGLTGAEYTRSDGHRYSILRFLNSSGDATGTSYRYSGGTTLMGQTAWVYDATSGQTYSMDLSIRDDGYSYSSISYFGDDGLALGYYDLYSGLDSLGRRAFAFSVEDGAYDLGLQVDGDLSTFGWDYLAYAVRESNGTIFGTGLLSGMPSGQAVFAMKVVPESSSILLLLASVPFVLFAARPLVRRGRGESTRAAA